MLKDRLTYKKLLLKWPNSILNFYFSYCADPKTIILCVIPANQDLAIADGLKLAR